MKTTQEIINFTMTFKKASISATFIFNEENENGELTFQNPVSGGSNEDIDAVLWGWSEQNMDEQAEWGQLIGLAKEFCDSELYSKINDGGTYDLEELSYNPIKN